MESNQALRLNGPSCEEVALLLHVASSPNRECLDSVHAEFGVGVNDGLVHFVCDSGRSKDFSLHGLFAIEVVLVAALRIEERSKVLVVELVRDLSEDLPGS